MPIKQNLFKRYFDFDGKRYEIHAIRRSKPEAEKIAESLRKRGEYKARMINFGDRWAIYKRRAALD
jgi:hypothetical protein